MDSSSGGTPNNSGGSNSSSLNSSKEGLSFLRPSFVKQMQRDFNFVNSYLISVFPIYPWLINFSSFIILLQIFLPSMLLGYDILYPRGQLIFYVSSVLSFFTDIIPVGSSLTASEVFIYIYLIVNLFVYMVIIACISIFHKTATVPKELVIIYYIMTTTKFFFLSPAAASAAAKLLFSNGLTSYRIFLGVLTLILYAISVIIELGKERFSVFFQPLSFSVFFQNGQIVIYLALGIIPFLSDTIRYEINVFKEITVTIIALCYLFIYIYFLKFNFILRKSERIPMSTTALCGFFLVIILLILSEYQIQVPIYIPIIIAIFWILLFVIHYIFDSKEAISSLRKLDQIQAELPSSIDPDFLSKMSENASEVYDCESYKLLKKMTTYVAIRMISFGYFASHEICLDYTIFQNLIDANPSNIYYMFCYAKFLIIFPDETMRLNLVLNKLDHMEPNNETLKDTFINYLLNHLRWNKYRIGIIQIKLLSMKRNTLLNKNLRHKLKNVTSLVETAKLRIRNTWETLLKGNSNEIIFSFEKMLHSVQTIENKFLSIINYNSSNHYSVRAHAIFRKDILADYDGYEELMERAKSFMLGKSIMIDQPCKYGHFYFKNLPTRIVVNRITTHPSHTSSMSHHHKKHGKQGTSTQTSGTAESLIDSGIFRHEELDLTEEQRYAYSSLRMSIDKIRFPIFWPTVIYHIVMFIIFGFGPLITLHLLYEYFEYHLHDPVTAVFYFGILRNSFSLLSGSAMLYYLEQTGNISFIYDCPNEYILPFGELNGVTNIFSQNLEEDIYFFAHQTIYMLELLNDFKKYQINTIYFQESIQILFHNQFEFYSLDNNFKIMTLNQKVHGIAQSGEFIMEYLKNNNQNKIDTFYNSDFFQSIIMNFININMLLDEGAEAMVNYVNSQCDQFLFIFLIVEISICIFIPVVHLIATILSSKTIKNLKKKIFCNVFQALPKNSIKKMINKLDRSILTDKNHEMRKSEEENHTQRAHGSAIVSKNKILNDLNKNDNINEDKTNHISALSIIRTKDDQNKNSRTVNFAFFIIFLIMFFYVVIYIYFIEMEKSLSRTYRRFTPDSNLLSVSFSGAFQSLVYLTSYVYLDQFEEILIAVDVNISNLLPQFFVHINKSLNAFNLLFFSHETEEIFSNYASFFRKSLQDYTNISFTLIDEYLLNISSLHDVYSSLSMIELYYFLVKMMERTLTLNSTYYMNDIWHTAFFHYYKEFFWHINQYAFEHMNNILFKDRTLNYSIMVIGLLIEFIILCFLMARITQIANRLKMGLSLLFHAPIESILASDYIMTIISGDIKGFDTKENEVNNKFISNDEYINTINNSNIGIFITQNDGKIVFINKAAIQIFNIDIPITDNPNKNICSLQNTDADTNISEILPKLNNDNNQSVEYNDQILRIQLVNNENQPNFKFYFVRNATKLINLITEIKNEKAKIQNLLNRILPCSISNKFKFEHHLSFLISQTTVMAIEILNSEKMKSDIEKEENLNPYAMMLSFLNELRKRYDLISPVEVVFNRFYLFGNYLKPNLPNAQVAKQIISFAVEVLALSTMHGLDITIGVTSGGPLSIGIVESSVPHFEFIGDIIDFANAMCSKNLLNGIHLSKPTYELVYDLASQYNIQECSKDMIHDQGNIATYKIQF